MSPLQMRLLAVVVFALAALVAGAVLAVIRLHAAALRRAPSRSGLLSWHVVSISVAHLLLLAGAALGALDALDVLKVPVALRFGLYISGSLMTLFALYLVFRGTRARVRRADARARVTPDGFAPRRHRRRRRARSPGTPGEHARPDAVTTTRPQPPLEDPS